MKHLGVILSLVWLMHAGPGWLGASRAGGAAALPPGRPYVLTIKGDNTVTFVPATGLAPRAIDYKANVEYLVNSRRIEPGTTKGTTARKPAGRRRSSKSGRVAKKGASDDAPKVAGAVDIAIHSAEMTFRQNARMVVQSRISRARFQGRFMPDTPVLSVTYNQAPPALQELLKTFDTTAASILIDDRSNVLARRVRGEGPLHAIIETLLSIHTPIPTDVAFWEAPTQLAMGHGQTAKGTLRFEKQQATATATLAETGGFVKVKVSGTLKAEGAVVGNLIKDGTYAVTGEQSYDPRTREWTSARWTVEIETELANQGVTVAHARGKMLVETRALAAASPAPKMK